LSGGRRRDESVRDLTEIGHFALCLVASKGSGEGREAIFPGSMSWIN
jgi:hypothetical protein